jgi:ubiquitin
MRYLFLLLALCGALPVHALETITLYAGCAGAGEADYYTAQTAPPGTAVSDIPGPWLDENVDQTNNFITDPGLAPTIKAGTVVLRAYIYVQDSITCDSLGECTDYRGSANGTVGLYKRTGAGTETLICSASMGSPAFVSSFAPFYHQVVTQCTVAADVVMGGTDRLIYRHFHNNAYSNPAGAAISYYHQLSTCGDSLGRTYAQYQSDTPIAVAAAPVIGIWQ